MRSKTLLWLSAIFMLIAMSSSITSMAARRVGQEQATKVATEAYVYGYPLVTMEMTRRVMTNTVIPTETHAPMGQFANAQRYSDTFFKDVATANEDTLSSSAWVDLSKEPYVLQLPDAGGRDYEMSIFTAWGEVIPSPVNRKAQRLAIVGPSWRGSLPPGVTEVESPTNLIWILGRTHSTGTSEDNKAVYALQQQYKLIPLSAYGKEYKPPTGIVDPNIDMKTPVRDQVNALSPENYFKLLLALMKKNPPALADTQIVAKMAKLGLVPGQEFSMRIIDPNVASSLEKAVKAGQALIAAPEKKPKNDQKSATASVSPDDQDVDYLARAKLTGSGLGVNL